MRRQTRQQTEREAWTRFVDGGAVATAHGPGLCSVCDQVIPEKRLARKIKTCSRACGIEAQSRKYGTRKVEWKGRLYDSQHEADIAAKLQALENGGKIYELKYQVPIELIPGNTEHKAIVFRADFMYLDEDGRVHVLDAKGFKTDVYRLKKRIAGLLLGLTIEEV